MADLETAETNTEEAAARGPLYVIVKNLPCRKGGKHSEKENRAHIERILKADATKGHGDLVSKIVDVKHGKNFKRHPIGTTYVKFSDAKSAEEACSRLRGKTVFAGSGASREKASIEAHLSWVGRAQRAEWEQQPQKQPAQNALGGGDESAYQAAYAEGYAEAGYAGAGYTQAGYAQAGYAEASGSGSAAMHSINPEAQDFRPQPPAIVDGRIDRHKGKDKGKAKDKGKGKMK